MEQLTRSTVKQLREELGKVIKPLEEKFGIILSVENVSYSSTEVRMKVVGKKGTSSEEVEKAEFIKCSYLFHINEGDYRKPFTFGGKTYCPVAFNMKARKNNLVIESDGKRYRMDSATYCMLKNTNIEVK